jgi:uncharacterized membrane protein YphA (DoxX/SURF4 family)
MDSIAKKEKVVTKKKGKVRKFFGSFVNVRAWVAYDELVANLGNTCGFFKRFFSRYQKEIRKESYEEAVARMALTEEQLQHRKNTFLKSAITYLIFVLILCGYAIYLSIKSKFLALFLVLFLLVPTILITYREHFWYMQMERKKLGCTFCEWLEFIFRRK